MAQYKIALFGKAPDPVNSGDTESWFYCYKWHPGEDDNVFFPVCREALPDIAVGDILWFIMDDRLIGRVTLDRIEVDHVSQKKELWYNTLTCEPAQGQPFISTPWLHHANESLQDAPIQTLEQLLKLCQYCQEISKKTP